MSGGENPGGVATDKCPVRMIRRILSVDTPVPAGAML